LHESTHAIPPFYDLPRYTSAFLETLNGRPDGTEPTQIKVSVSDVMPILADGCFLAEETDPGYIYECWFLSRGGRVVRFSGYGQGQLYLVSGDFAESMLANFLSDADMDALRSHGIITSELLE